jgi:HlyD family secretion protein
MDRRIEKKKWPPKKIALVGGAGLFVLYVIYALAANTGSRLNVEAERLTISTVVKGPFQEYIPVNGIVQPIRTFYLDAVEGGRIEEKFVEAGAFVRKGDPILRMGNTNLQLDVMYREALSYEQINNARNTSITIEQNTISVRQEVAEAEFQFQQAARNYVRDSTLAARDLASPMEFKRSQDEYAYWKERKAISLEHSRQDSILRQNQLGQLDASIRRMNANLDLTRKNLENLTLRAPITGQLSSLNGEIGQSKSAGERLGQIDVLDSFKVRVPVDEFYIARVSPGQTGECELAGDTFKLAIRKVFPEVREGRFEVDMEFTGKVPAGLRRGQTLQIRLELGRLEEAVMVPRGGFYQKTGGQWIFVVDPSGDFAVRRPIRLSRQNPQVFEVLDGLAVGERVVTSSYDNFGDAGRLVIGR